jgi:hypothetical protein
MKTGEKGEVVLTTVHVHEQYSGGVINRFLKVGCIHHGTKFVVVDYGSLRVVEKSMTLCLVVIA